MKKDTYYITAAMYVIASAFSASLINTYVWASFALIAAFNLLLSFRKQD